MLGIKRAGESVEIFGSASEWEEFRAACLFVSGAVSKDKSLPAFNAVALEICSDHVAGLVATDRFRMHVASLRGGFDRFLNESREETYLIDGAKLAGAVKAKKSGAWILNIEAGAWSLSSGGQVIKSDLIAADFPNFRQVWRAPIESAPKNIAINPAILGGSLSAIDKNYPGEIATRINFTGDELKPIVLDNFNDSARALVMPCRVV